MRAVVHDHSRESEIDSCGKENGSNRETDDLTTLHQHCFLENWRGTYMRNGVELNMLCFIIIRAR
jgi:hypothetical protein